MEPPSHLNNFFKSFLVIDLVVLNLAVVYLGYKSQIPISNSQINSNSQTPITQINDKCGDDCQKYIEQAIQARQALQATPTPTAVPVKVTTKTPVRREEMMTIPGSGSTSANDWADITGTYFYFDTRDWPGLAEVYFEANMKLFNGNGVAYVRLFDETHGIGVTGSENDTTSQVNVWAKSQKVTFWAGRNLIKVQGKSLTADTVVYNQGRLRIVTEN